MNNVAFTSINFEIIVNLKKSIIISNFQTDDLQWQLFRVCFTLNMTGESWFLAKNVSDFVTLPRKLHNHYCHTLKDVSLTTILNAQVYTHHLELLLTFSRLNNFRHFFHLDYLPTKRRYGHTGSEPYLAAVSLFFELENWS